jgi:hypothetical protein
MPLRLATLLTIVLLAIPSWSGDTKVAPKRRGKDSHAEEQARAAQDRAYQESINAQCRAAWGTDCTQHSLEENRQLQKRLMEMQREQGPFFPRGCERVLSADGCGRPPAFVRL